MLIRVQGEPAGAVPGGVPRRDAEHVDQPDGGAGRAAAGRVRHAARPVRGVRRPGRRALANTMQANNQTSVQTHYLIQGKTYSDIIVIPAVQT